MQLPLEIVSRDVSLPDAAEREIRAKANKLGQLHPRITHCRVVVEVPHRHQSKGSHYRVRLHLGVPGHEVVVDRDPSENAAHEGLRPAIRDAFQAAHRQLTDYIEKRRRQTKHHKVPPHGRIAQLYPEAGYGVIEGSDGRELQFLFDDLVANGVNRLEIGKEVRFHEEDRGGRFQAVGVRLVGKHHHLS